MAHKKDRGNTRIVHGDAGQKLVALESDEEVLLYFKFKECIPKQSLQFDPSVIPLKTVEEFEDTLELPFHYNMVASYPHIAGSVVGRGSSYKGSEMRQV